MAGATEHVRVHGVGGRNHQAVGVGGGILHLILDAAHLNGALLHKLGDLRQVVRAELGAERLAQAERGGVGGAALDGSLGSLGSSTKVRSAGDMLKLHRFGLV